MASTALFDPQLHILQAFYTALSGLPLPVYTVVPLVDANGSPVDEYVLISQPTLVQGSGSAACRAWDATLLLSIYHKFEQRNTVSLVPGLTLSDEVLGRLLGQRLGLGSFSMSPIELVMASNSQSSNDLAVYDQRNLRLRFTVYG